ncbi:MAG: hypothetical protein MUD14_07260 [Hydrococcus sp. Prado102]|jgi:hypothetical protein|nr:hypothetical protein [Hydrococcus sp. Prado102]
MNRYLLLLLIFCTALFACHASIGLSEQTLVEKAYSTNNFIDSIGVAVHLDYQDTVYSRYKDIIKPRLQELGIRHIRGSVRLKDLETQQKFLDLATIGIKSTLVIDPRRVSSPAKAVKIAKAVMGSVEALEGANEWDLHSDLEYKGENFPHGVRKFQEKLYAAIKRDPVTASLAVLSPSVAKANKASELGKVACDRAAIHSYPGGHKVPSSGLEDKWIPAARMLCGDKPIMATESGYHNAIHLYGISEQAAAKYLPRMFLEYFNRGIDRTYSYELIDLKPNPAADEPEFNYGLLRNDGSPKPAFIAIKNAIALLKDTDESFTLQSLNYTLKGNTQNIHHTLLQKHDETFYLIFWQEVLSYDVNKKTDILVSARPLSLILQTPISRAAIYKPTDSMNAIAQYINPKTLKINVPDRPLIIELVSI